MRTVGKRRGILLIALMCLAAFALYACNNKKQEPEKKAVELSLGQSTAYFTSADDALYPIVGQLPGEGEAVEKSIKLKFANAGKVGLALEYDDDAVPSGLRYAVNNGQATEISRGGEILNAAVAKTETEKTVNLKIWLSADAPESSAGKSFSFAIVAKAAADSNADWEKTVTLADNTVTVGRPNTPYGWSQTAKDYQTNGITYITAEGVGTPLDLRTMFGAPTLTATFTPTGGTETKVEHPEAFEPSGAGTLKLTATAAWRTPTTLTVAVTIEAKSTVTFAVSYPDWYEETGDTITVTAKAAGEESATPVDVIDKGSNTYAVQVKDGTYDFTVSSARFRTESAESFALNNVEVSGPTSLTESGSFAFTTPKLLKDDGVNGFVDDSAVTYNASGFSLPRASATFRPLAGDIVATEGFTVSYTMETGASPLGEPWTSGGLSFKKDGLWYSVLVYADKNELQRSVCIGVAASTIGVGKSPERVFTSVKLENDTTVDVQIAYYDGAFYIKIDGNFAVRLGAELFASDRHCTSNACPIYLLESEYNKVQNAMTHSEVSKIDDYFGAGNRTLGFRTVDFANTFTNVQYALGNDAAKAAVEEMYAVAKANTEKPICTEEHGNPWPCAWAQAATDTARDGITGTALDGVGTPIDLYTLCGETDFTATFTPAGGNETAVEDPGAFAPTSSGTLKLIPTEAWKERQTLDVPVTLVAQSTVTFTVTYPDGYDQADYDGDTITVTAKASGAESAVDVTVTGKGNNQYSIVLVNGTYELSVTSERFKYSATADAVTLSNVEITGTCDINTDHPVEFAVAQTTPYVWSQDAKDYQTTGMEYATVDGVGTPINLYTTFGVETTATLSATFTPAGGTATAVADLTAFAPSGDGSLTLTASDKWHSETDLTVSVTTEAKSTVTFTVTYPDWYKETGDTIIAKVDGTAATLTADASANTYTTVVSNGTHTFDVTSARFRTATSESVTLSDVTVSGATNLTASTAITFTTPKLMTEAPSGTTDTVTYNGSGFEITRSGNKIFHPLAGGVKATEGFVVSYTMKSYSGIASPYTSGGLCFKMGDIWYTLVAAPYKNGAGNAYIEPGADKVGGSQALGAITVDMGDSKVSGGDTVVDVQIAYYNGAFYVKIKDGAAGKKAVAVQLKPCLFASDRHCKDASCPIRLLDAYYNNTIARMKVANVSKINDYFAAGERILGFRTTDFVNTFTNVQYELGNEAAKAAVREMYLIASTQTPGICTAAKGNPWPDWLETETQALEAILPSKDTEEEENA